MDFDLLFSLSTYAVLPAWWLLTFAPKWKWTWRIVQNIWIPGALACYFAFLIFTRGPRVEGADTLSLQGLLLLFSQPEAVLIGWVHYLTFDLFVGAWQVRDSQHHNIHPVLVAPCLFLTFAVGPIGLLLYFSIRYGLRRQSDLGAKP